MPADLRKADLVSNHLLSRIVSGGYEVGALLPREQELAEKYGVNKSVIREAIKSLEVHRLVRPIKRRGTEVLDPTCSPSPDVLKAMLMPRPGVLDRQILADLLEIRAELDEQMTALAAERRSDDDLVQLDACADRLERCIEHPRDYSLAIDDLGATLARASRNRVYQMLVQWHQRVHSDLGEVLAIARVPNEAHIQGVRFLIQSIRDHEVETARAIVRGFQRWAMPRILAVAAIQAGDLPSLEPGASR